MRRAGVLAVWICWGAMASNHANAQGLWAPPGFNPWPGGPLPRFVLPQPPASPIPRITAIVNGASSGSNGEAAPGSFVTIYGSNFGSKDKLGDLFPATEFEGLSAKFSGRSLPGEVRAPLFHVIASRNQINLLTPAELPQSGKALVIPEAVARHLRLPDDCAGVSALADCGQPASPGDDIQIFVTGLGRATPGGGPGGEPLRTGSVAPADGQPLYLTVQKPLVTIGEAPAEVQFSGLAPGFAGLYQVNVRVPSGAPRGDEVPITIAMPDGHPDKAAIAIPW